MRVRAALPILLLFAASCTPAGSAPAPPGAPAVPEVRSGADIRLPFDRYLMTPEQRRTVTLAEQRIARTCMSRFGFDWPVPDLPAVPAGSTNARRYGVLDPAEVAQLGYHPPADPAPPAAPPGTSPEMMMVYGGRGGVSELAGRPIPDGGCLGEARRELGIGAVGLGSPELNRISTDSFTQAQHDPRHAAVNAAWSACMKQSGYAYADIWRANNDPRWSDRQPSALELATARADVACKLSTRVPTVLLTIETELQTTAIRRHAGALDRAGTHQAETVTRAAALLARPAV
ncbi:hypothetical protein OHV05_02430 [Kitasatospora sp. NBC_00070]|uniref:hypothetical protein n=1 Tax=Kitasatospora sp. NBC_00070 TaxID=2975962 RepID=UPI003251028D